MTSTVRKDPIMGGFKLARARYNSIKAGGSGLFFGRNVFQHKNPTLMVKALSAIVHHDASVEKALEIFGGPK